MYYTYILYINMIWQYIHVMAVIIRVEWITAIYSTVYAYQEAIILLADKKLSLIRIGSQLGKYIW